MRVILQYICDFTLFLTSSAKQKNKKISDPQEKSLLFKVRQRNYNNTGCDHLPSSERPIRLSIFNKNRVEL